MHLYNLFALIFIFVVIVFCKSEECLNVDEDGTCLQPCPDGTFSYTTSCEDASMSQRTCRQPKPRSIGVLCDYTRCDCPDLKYWDEAAKKCVELDQCSDQSKVVDEAN